MLSCQPLLLTTEALLPSLPPASLKGTQIGSHCYHSSKLVLSKSKAELYFLSLVTFLNLDFLKKFEMAELSGDLRYLFQNISVLYPSTAPEEEEAPEVPDEKLESDEALERNENVESFPLFSSVAGLVCLVCCLLVTSLGLKEVT